MLDENLALKKQINELQQRIDEFSRRENEVIVIREEYEKRIREYEEKIIVIREEYEKTIKELTTKLTELGGKSMDKGKYK